MIPVMEDELVDKRHWMNREEFLDQLALSQSMPGVLAVNMATGLGYRLRGAWGAMSAVAGNIVAPIMIVLLLAMFFRQLRGYPVVEHFFMGVRPAVVALIAAPVFRLAKSAQVTWSTCWIPILSALLIWLFDVSPIFIIIAALVLGFLYGRWSDRRNSNPNGDKLS